MARLKIVDYKPEHLEKLKLKSIYDGEGAHAVNATAVTVLLGDAPIAVLGGSLIMPGVMQVFGLISEDVRKASHAFHKSTRLLIEYCFENFSLRRMQMSVWVQYQEGYKWAKALGFACEGIMRNYRPDNEACWMFARCA